MITVETVKEFVAGKKTFAQLVDLTEERATRYLRMGVDQMRAGNFDEAARIFGCLASLNPLDADAHALQGTALQAQGKHGEALEAFTQALARNPKHLVALAARGELRRKLGDEGGLADLKRAAELDPMGTTAAGKRAAQVVRALTFRPAGAKAAVRR